MKRVAVFSDSHGMTSRLREAAMIALQRGRVDVAVFLGDGQGDFRAVAPLFQDAECLSVRGNNDFGFSVPQELAFTVNGARFYACHGHQWHVKYGLERLCYAAREREARVALFGHTHQSFLQYEYGIWLVNPGAVCSPGTRGFACADIRVEDGGAVHAELARW